MANKRVVLLDANAILRYMLHDIEEQYITVKERVDAGICAVTLEVLAEVSYVLEGLYQVPRYDIIEGFRRLCANIAVQNLDVLWRAMEIYDESPKLDFVDCILYGYSKARGVDVLTFDKKLNRMLRE